MIREEVMKGGHHDTISLKVPASCYTVNIDENYIPLPRLNIKLLKQKRISFAPKLKDKKYFFENKKTNILRTTHS
jgi:hypothetical protein